MPNKINCLIFILFLTSMPYATWASNSSQILVQGAITTPTISDVLQRSLLTSSCQKAAFEISRRWGATAQWKRFFHPDSNHQLWRAPAQSIGTWVEINLKSRGSEAREVDIRKVSDETTLQASLKEPVCKPIIRVIHRQFAADWRKNAFTGRDLARLVATRNRGVIFVWTPNSIHSTEGLKEAQEAARRVHVPLTVLISPYADDRQTRVVAKLHSIRMRGFKRLESLDLIFRGALNHHPTLFFFKNKHMHPYIHQGLETRDEYEAIMREFLKNENEPNRRAISFGSVGPVSAS